MKADEPFRCPICGGNGLVPPGFYATVTGVNSGTSTAPEQCRPCAGTGVLWGSNWAAATLRELEKDSRDE